MRIAKAMFFAILVGAAAYFCLSAPVRSMLGADGTELAAEDWQNPYITDGLIAQWDGEWNVGGGIHHAGATVWRDIVSGIVAVPNNFKLSADYQAVFDDKSYRLRHANLSFNAPWLTDVFNTHVCTWEVAAIRREGTSRIYLFSDDSHASPGSFQDGNTAFYLKCGAVRGDASRTALYGNGTFRQDIYVTQSNVFDNGARYTYSSGLFVKGVTVEEGISSEISMLTGSCYLFGDFTTCADIYSIRIYDRALSAEEIEHNAAIDAERFGL